MSWDVICADACEQLAGMAACSVDLTVTSPPYDGLRSYNGQKPFTFEKFQDIARELYRVTKDGGVVVWVVSDQTTNGSESGNSFRQALFFKEVGFRLHDTMIYQKVNPVPNAGNRYQQEFEYMFVLSKGAPKTTNIMTEPRRNTCNDRRKSRVKVVNRDGDGNFGKPKLHIVKELVPKRNIWAYKVGQHNSATDDIAFEHPAIFPEQLAADHIASWSNPGDLVFDPFCGSGTVGKMAVLAGRDFVGIDIDEQYCELTRRRIALAL